MNRMTFPGVLLILALALSITVRPAQAVGIVPAPPAGGPRPTIELASTNGFAGGTITVSGLGAAGFSTVRIAWLLDRDADGALDRTRTAALSAPVRGDAYSADITVPSDLAPGAVAVCAAVSDPAAEFVCTPFVITLPPPGSVSGSIAAAATPGDSYFVLIDPISGEEVASTPIAPDGTFVLGGVPPGTYDGEVIGEVTEPVEIEGGIDVSPAGSAVVSTIPAIASFCDSGAPGEHGTVVGIGATPTLRTVPLPILTTVDQLGLDESFFGYYFSGAGGDPQDVFFTARVQDPSPLFAGVRFRLIDSAGTVVWEDSTAAIDPPYLVSAPDLGAFPPAAYEIEATVLVSGLGGPTEDCLGRRKGLVLLPNPTFESPYSTGSLTYDSASRRFALEGWMPNIFGLLSVEFPSGGASVPYLGDITSRYDAGFQVAADLDLNGIVNVTTCRAAVEATLFGEPVLDETLYDFLPDATLSQRGAGPVLFGFGALPLGPYGEAKDPRSASISVGPYKLFEDKWEWEVYEGTLATYWGIITVKASIDLSLGASIIVSGEKRPVEPMLLSRALPIVEPGIDFSIYVDVIKLAKGGATVTTAALLSYPLVYDSREVPNIFFEDECLGLKATASIWAKFLGKKYNLAEKILFCKEEGDDGCSALCSSRGAGPEVALPDALAWPAVAAGPAGRMLSVCVEDTAPGADLNNVVQARFWNPMTQSWGPPTSLSTGANSGIDPAAAFVGVGGDAWVAWTHNNTNELGPLPPDNENAELAAQEIAVRFWSAGPQMWMPAQILTGDTVGDGLPAIAGDSAGATLAWVRDQDGNAATNDDVVIAVRNWISGLDWDDVMLLDASAALAAAGFPGADASNTQVTVARHGGSAYLMWTADADHDWNTNTDRRLALAIGTPVPAPNPGTPHYFTWAIFVPSGLPAGAGQPSLAADPTDGHLEAALVVRGKDADGVTDSGFGNRARLWHGRRDGGGLWTSAELVDGSDPVRAELPIMRFAFNGRAAITLRRFGAANSSRFRGQLAVSVREPGIVTWPAPAWITDEPSQHWQQSAAFDSSGRLFVLDVNRRDVSPGPFVPGLTPCMAGNRLNNADEPVEWRIVDSPIELAIDVSPVVSELHAAVDTPVQVIATVRNLGAQPATNLSVQFFDGPSDAFPMIANVPVPGPLRFNQAANAQAVVQRAPGLQPMFVKVVPGPPGFDPCPLNNGRLIELGPIPAPTFARTSASTVIDGAVEITCIPPPVADIGGYRFLRATQPGGAYQNIGEAIDPYMTDVESERGVAYSYVVQAYDAAGVFSPYSGEATVTVPAIHTLAWINTNGGPWPDAASWNLSIAPAEGDDVTIGAAGTYTVSFAANANAGSLVLGAPGASPTLDLASNTLSLLKISRVEPGATLRMAGAGLWLGESGLLNQGTLDCVGLGSEARGRVVNDAMGQLLIRGAAAAPTEVTASFDRGLVNRGSLSIQGFTLGQAGVLEVTGGRLENAVGAQINVHPSGPQAHVLRAQLRNDGMISVQGDLSVDQASAAQVNAGTLDLDGGDLTFVQSGPAARVSNWGAILVKPARTLTITTGDFDQLAILDIAASGRVALATRFIQHSSGELAIELGEPAPGLNEVLGISGSAALAGRLALSLAAGYAPPAGETLTILSATSGVTGQFESVAPAMLPGGRVPVVQYLANAVTVTLNCAPFDADCDGDVDLDDHAALADCLAGPGAGPAPPPPVTAAQCLTAFDDDSDADVDLSDAAGFQAIVTP